MGVTSTAYRAPSRAGATSATRPLQVASRARVEPSYCAGTQKPQTVTSLSATLVHACADGTCSKHSGHVGLSHASCITVGYSGQSVWAAAVAESVLRASQDISPRLLHQGTGGFFQRTKGEPLTSTPPHMPSWRHTSLIRARDKCALCSTDMHFNKRPSTGSACVQHDTALSQHMVPPPVCGVERLATTQVCCNCLASRNVGHGWARAPAQHSTRVPVSLCVSHADNQRGI